MLKIMIILIIMFIIIVAIVDIVDEYMNITYIYNDQKFKDNSFLILVHFGCVYSLFT